MHGGFVSNARVSLVGMGLPGSPFVNGPLMMIRPCGCPVCRIDSVVLAVVSHRYALLAIELNLFMILSHRTKA